MADTSPDVVIIDGTPRVSSLAIAEHFEKRHDNIIRDIRKLEIPNDFRLLNFEESTYVNEQGKEQPCFNLTRDAFVLLTMGFSGKKALAWKIRYIEAFNTMEKKLVEKSRPKVVSHFYPDPTPPTFIDEEFFAPENRPAGYGHPDWNELIRARDEWMEVAKYSREVAMDDILDFLGASCLENMTPGQLRKATAWVKEKIARYKAQAAYESRSKAKKKGSTRLLPPPEQKALPMRSSDVSNLAIDLYSHICEAEADLNKAKMRLSSVKKIIEDINSQAIGDGQSQV